MIGSEIIKIKEQSCKLHKITLYKKGLIFCNRRVNRVQNILKIIEETNVHSLKKTLLFSNLFFVEIFQIK